jgi:membrane protein
MSKNVITLAASVSFFGFLSLFPFLVLIASVASFFLRWRQMIPQMERLLNPLPQSLADTVMQTLRGAIAQGGVVSVLSFMFLIYTSFSVFAQLRFALNKIMGTSRPPNGWIATLKAFGFFLAVALILILLVLGGSVLFVLAAKHGKTSLMRSFWVLESVTLLAEFLLFSFSYRYLADKKPLWKNALLGGLVASVSWEILKILFGWYVSSINNFTAVYGVIGSVFFVMMWMFYSVLIYFVGAHLSVELR